jgi:hypothetical protein
MIGTPAEGSTAGISLYEGCLLVLTLTGRGESRYQNLETNPLKPFIQADVLVVDSPKRGHLGTQTSSTPPKVIDSAPGDKGSIIASQGYLVGAFRGKNIGDVIGGRLGVRFVDNKGGQNKPEWYLTTPEGAEYEAANRAYEASRTGQVQRPAQSDPWGAPSQSAQSFTAPPAQQQSYSQPAANEPPPF